MRSYTYSGGTWQVIDDPLPRVTMSTTSSLPDYDFRQALLPLGFRDFGSENLECRTGKVKVYARDHEKLNAKRQAKEFPYDFVCLLKMGYAYIRVWLADLPSLFLFLVEIDARPEEEEKSIVDRTNLSEMISSIESLADDIMRGDLEITVKPPKPPTRRS